MKKKMLGVFLAVFLTVPSFTQETSNAVYVDFGSTILGLLYRGFGIGLGYERGLTKAFSALVSAGCIGYKNEFSNYLGLSAGLHVRWYPLANAVRKWFFDIGGNYSYIAMTYGEKTVSNVFDAEILTGWKFVFGKKSNGFFLEPGIGYRHLFGEIKTPQGIGAVPSLTGLRLCLGMGWAF